VLAVSYKPLDAAAEAALFEYPTSPEKDDDEAALDSSLCVDRDIIAVDFFLVVAREAWKSSWIIFCSKEVVAVFSVPGSCFTGAFWREWAHFRLGSETFWGEFRTDTLF
jgi:hypothetical protein